MGPQPIRRLPAASPPQLACRPRRSPQIAGVPRRRRSNRGNICSAVNQSNVGPVSAVAAAAAAAPAAASSSSARGGGAAGAGGGRALRLAPRPRALPETGANEGQRLLKKEGAASPLPSWVGGGDGRGELPLRCSPRGRGAPACPRLRGPRRARPGRLSLRPSSRACTREAPRRYCRGSPGRPTAPPVPGGAGHAERCPATVTKCDVI